MTRPPVTPPRSSRSAQTQRSRAPYRAAGNPENSLTTSLTLSVKAGSLSRRIWAVAPPCSRTTHKKARSDGSARTCRATKPEVHHNRQFKITLVWRPVTAFSSRSVINHRREPRSEPPDRREYTDHAVA
jgi:hypothetical protein